jgi:hypothetical protein
MTVEKFDPSAHLTDLHGKSYMEAKWRVMWFREENPNGTIDTHTDFLDDQFVVMRARVTKQDGGGSATGYGSGAKATSSQYSGRYVEKAETAAIARALAHLGYGTQFADADFEEAPEGVDSAVPRKGRPKQAANAKRPAPPNGEVRPADMAARRTLIEGAQQAYKQRRPTLAALEGFMSEAVRVKDGQKMLSLATLADEEIVKLTTWLRADDDPGPAAPAAAAAQPAALGE